MFDKQAKSIEVLSNIGIVIVSVLGAAVLIRQLAFAHPVTQAPASAPQPVADSYAPTPRPLARPPAPVVGSELSVAGIQWTTREQTLLLVLSTTCHFCTDSAPFYRRLAEESRRHDRTRLVAVLPQPKTEGAQFLSSLGIRIDEVVQAPLGSVGTRGTPTLILVGRDGKVKKFWMGRLPSERESEVVNAL
ncbi:MAG: hypothetical protein A3H96_07080 [Acidobacteria bacterium RIFCSPLOWO2_02_FULL_67_36]|nr:MAG: hypothetical protein A3H96_07080 [Acidobacteria bacterium RIFCSPLOWO2_02_FULL_67_36]OFW26512.1 MAG: hypothetical protein A3G21_24245 [Acidobacteria bacterium RIFCSPLOWO2_12_FULL_66_21]